MPPILESFYHDLSIQFKKMADLFHEKFMESIPSMSPQEFSEADRHEALLRMYSSYFLTLAIETIAKEVKPYVDDIKKCMDEANVVIQKIKRVRAILVLAADAINLGAAIIAMDPGSILSGISKLIQDLQQIQVKEEAVKTEALPMAVAPGLAKPYWVFYNAINHDNVGWLFAAGWTYRPVLSIRLVQGSSEGIFNLVMQPFYGEAPQEASPFSSSIVIPVNCKSIHVIDDYGTHQIQVNSVMLDKPGMNTSGTWVLSD
jgi:hypothetical protein